MRIGSRPPTRARLASPTTSPTTLPRLAPALDPTLEPARRVGSAGSRSTCRMFVTRYPSLHVTNHHPRRAHRHRRRLAGAVHALHSAVVADALSRASKMRRRRNSDGARDHARTHDIARGVRVTRATPYLGKSVCARATNVFSPSRGADRRVDAATRRHPTDTDRRRRARGRSVRKIRTRRSIGARRAVARLSRHRHFDMRVEASIIDRRCRVFSDDETTSVAPDLRHNATHRARQKCSNGCGRSGAAGRRRRTPRRRMNDRENIRKNATPPARFFKRRLRRND